MRETLEGLRLTDFAEVVGLSRDEFRMARFRGALVLPSMTDPRMGQAILQTLVTATSDQPLTA